eukprot:1587141-Amphidinium_carterae.1
MLPQQPSLTARMYGSTHGSQLPICASRRISIQETQVASTGEQHHTGRFQVLSSNMTTEGCQQVWWVHAISDRGGPGELRVRATAKL